MYKFAIVLTSIFFGGECFSIGGEQLEGAATNFGLINRLSNERRENEAVARLYENVLDILQCRQPPEDVVDRRVIGERDYLARQPIQDQNWKSPKGLGQVSGVSVDPSGRPVIFHRGDHVWEYDSFDSNYQYTKLEDGPISVNTVLTLNPESGEIEDGWASETFYLPHGVHVDSQGNYWLTDVALHQVFKYPRRERFGMGELEPSLVLGERFIPGSDSSHFCQPTAVAVMPTGEIVIADGYCNNRIVVFTPDGGLLGQIPPYGNENLLRLRVPHSLTIMKEGDVCVADREHQRIVCFNLSDQLKARRDDDDDDDKTPSRLSQIPGLAVYRPGVCRIFGIASHDDLLYAINGPTTPNNPIMGFTVNTDTESVISTWGPTFDTFNNPHEIATCQNGTSLYVTEVGPNVVWKFRLLTNWKM